MHRVVASHHFDTFCGWLAITFGVVCALCFVVGIAVVLDAIARWVR